MRVLVFSRRAPRAVTLLLLVLLLFQGCEVPPEVHVRPANPPEFTFSRGTVVEMLLVYHLRSEEVGKGIFLEQLMNDKANAMWRIEGKHEPQVPIIYGAVPADMQETVQASPLVEGEYYLVYTSSLVGATFRIQDAKANEIKR